MWMCNYKHCCMTQDDIASDIRWHGLLPSLHRLYWDIVFVFTDLCLPAECVSAVYHWGWHLGVVRRIQVPEHPSVGQLCPRQRWRRRLRRKGRGRHGHRDPRLPVLHHRPQHSRTHLSLCQVGSHKSFLLTLGFISGIVSLFTMLLIFPYAVWLQSSDDGQLFVSARVALWHSR